MFRLGRSFTRATPAECFIKFAACQRFFRSKKYASTGSYHLSTTYDSLDSTSFKTMEKILDILHNAEERADTNNKTKQENDERIDFDTRWGTELGKDLFQYQVMKLIGESTLVHNEEYKVSGKSMDQFILQMSNSLVANRNSFFKTSEASLQSSLNVFQSIAKYFIMNDRQCSRILGQEISSLSSDLIPIHFTKASYSFPNIRLPQPFRYGDTGLFTIRKAFNTKKHQLNLLPFLLKNRIVVEDVITKFQRKNKVRITTPDMIMGIMEIQEAQGRSILRFLAKKILFKHPELEAGFVQDITGSRELKLIIAHHSRLPSRLFSYTNYKNAVFKFVRANNLNKNDIMTIMEEQFERFFSVFYAAHPADCEKWLTNVLLNINKDPSAVGEPEVAEAISYFRSLMHDCFFTVNTTYWKEKR